MGYRFNYAGPYKTRDAAERALEDCYASGEVSLGERPMVEFMANRYYVTLPDEFYSAHDRG